MPATLDDVLARLDALLAEQTRTRKAMEALALHLGAARTNHGPAGASSSGGGPTPAAPDAELDSPKGDPEVRKDPKRWTGAPMAPRRMSMGSPEWLDAVAEAKDYSAGRNDADAAKLTGDEAATKKKYADYDRRDAARARGWAARLRAKPARCDGDHPAPPCTSPHCWQREPPAGEEEFA